MGRRKIRRMVAMNVESLGIAADMLIVAGQQAGLSVRDLNTLLDAGMSVEQLVDYITAKLADRLVED